MQGRKVLLSHTYILKLIVLHVFLSKIGAKAKCIANAFIISNCLKTLYLYRNLFLQFNYCNFNIKLLF